ncbi:glycosyltransferase [Xylophilus sp. Kf1]|nr:glycosyltransferase [Xylophilus sp. Kf1]
MSILTIAIPTFNRAACLESLLESLCNQRSISEAQILVSDNGSTDHTAAVLDGYKHRLNLKVVGFSKNKGFDQNYRNCLIHAEGEFLWIMGDDDKLLPEAVASVCAKLSDDQTDLLIINGGDFKAGTLIPRIRYAVHAVKDTSDLMSQFGWHICWIGTTIIRRSLIKSELLVPSDWNAFIHIPLIVRSHSVDWRTHFDAAIRIHPTVNNSAYSKAPVSLVKTFGMQLYETLAGLSSVISPDSRVKTVRGFARNLAMFDARALASWRRAGLIGITDFIKNIKYFYRVNPRLLFYSGLLFFPPKFFKLISPNK